MSRLRFLGGPSIALMLLCAACATDKAGSGFAATDTISSGRPLAMYPTNDLASLLGYSDEIVVARLLSATPGQTIFGIDGSPMSTDRLQQLEVLTSISGGLRPGSKFTLLQDSWNGKGQGVRTGRLNWLSVGQTALYFLTQVDQRNTPYDFPVFAQTSPAGRVVESSAGSAELADSAAPETSALSGQSFAGVIDEIQQAMREQSKVIEVASQAKKAAQAERIPVKLPAILSVTTLDEFVSVDGTKYALTFGLRSGGLACYSFGTTRESAEPDQCFRITDTTLAEQPSTQYTIVPMGPYSRALIGFTRDVGNTVKIGFAGGDKTTISLRDVPALPPFRYFTLMLKEDSQVVEVLVG